MLAITVLITSFLAIPFTAITASEKVRSYLDVSAVLDIIIGKAVSDPPKPFVGASVRVIQESVQLVVCSGTRKKIYLDTVHCNVSGKQCKGYSSNDNYTVHLFFLIQYPVMLIVSVFIVATGLTWPYRDHCSTILDLLLSVDVMLLLLFRTPDNS